MPICRRQEFIMSIMTQLANRARRLARRRRPGRTIRPAKVPLLLEVLEGRHLPSVSLGTNFDGLSSVGNDCGCSPPDTIGAAGPSSFVESVNTAMGTYNKATGAQTGRVELGSFFNAGLGGVLSLSDPVVIYDEMANKFFLGTQGATLFLSGHSQGSLWQHGHQLPGHRQLGEHRP
jgi:hypothetical protein